MRVRSALSVLSAPVCLALLVVTPSPAKAAVITLSAAEFAGTSLITFNGIAHNTPVNGMTIDSVLFSYLLNDVPSNELTVRIEPPITNNISPPHLSNRAGTNANALLRLTFAMPTERLGYGFAFNTGTTIPTGSTATLFDATDAMVGVLSANAIAEPTFSGGFLGLRSTIPFVRADITFAPVASAFVFDNLRFAPAAPIPEPASITLLLVGLGGLARRLRSQS